MFEKCKKIYIIYRRREIRKEEKRSNYIKNNFFD